MAAGIIDGFDWTPYYKDGLVFMDNTLKGGELASLVKYITSQESGAESVKEFQTSFRTFTTPRKLLELLINRIEPDNWSESADLTVVRHRVVSFIQKWIRDYDVDWRNDTALRRKLREFLQTNTAIPSMARGFGTLLNQLERVVEEPQQKPITRPKPPPKPYVPAVFKDATLLDFHPEEVARQLTLLDWELWVKIKPWECLSWNKSATTEKDAPNVYAMISHFNRISGWASSVIVETEDFKLRVKVLYKMIKLAMKLYELRNFNSLWAIVAGINLSCVSRLKHTWAKLKKTNKATIQKFEDLRTTVKKEKLRSLLKQSAPPSIPFLGVYLTELQHIDEGNSDYLTGLESSKVVNFQKRKMMTGVISTIRQWQQQPYNFFDVGVIQSYLLNCRVTDEDTKYHFSLKIEPRGSTAKEIAGKSSKAKQTKKTSVGVLKQGDVRKSSSVGSLSAITKNQRNDSVAANMRMTTPGAVSARNSNELTKKNTSKSYDSWSPVRLHSVGLPRRNNNFEDTGSASTTPPSEVKRRATIATLSSVNASQ